MGCLVAIPKRDLSGFWRQELTPVSSDVFVSIPKRDSIPLFYGQTRAPTSLSLPSADIFN